MTLFQMAKIKGYQFKQERPQNKLATKAVD